MTSTSSSSPFSAFATADAGFEYLATAEHYRYLAKGIIVALRCRCLVLVTGNPPPKPPMLVAALREAAAPRAVIERACGPDLDCQTLLGDGLIRADTPAPVAIGEELECSTPTSPIFVFANTERLSDHQIEELREAAQAMPHRPNGLEAGVLLAPSDFVIRAESTELHLLDEGLAAHLRLQQLEREEVEAFIRYQLPPGGAANLLTAQRAALIEVTSGGDPAVVNRLMRRMIENQRASATPPRRYGVSLWLSAGIIFCLGAAWLIAGAFERPDLGAIVGLARDRILPRNERVEVRAPLGAAPSAGGANIAAAPPSITFAGDTTPVAPSADHPGATSAPRSTPQPTLQPVADAPRLSSVNVATAPPSTFAGETTPVAPGATSAPGSTPQPTLQPAAAAPRLSSANVAAAPRSITSAGETTPVATSADHPGATSAPGLTPQPTLRPVADAPRLSSANVAAAPPRITSAGETTPVATSADHPGATSLGSTPQPTLKPVVDAPQISADEIAALVARGDAFIGAGDIASARLFFERAAASGDSRAAMHMAVTYDAAFLDRAGLRSVRSDPERAAFWYRRAREMSEGKAEPLLDSLGTHSSAEPPLQPR
jgi:hypothetical protein